MTCETPQLQLELLFPSITTTTTTTMKSSSDNSSSSSPRKNDYLSSRDWMSDYKQSHVDVDYNRMDLLSSSTTNTNKKMNPNTTETTVHQQPNTNISSGGTTDWGAMFHKSIGTAAEPASSSNILPPPNFSEQRMMSSSSISSIGGLLAPLPERSASTSSFKPSVDFGSFLTPSTDALINGALASSCSDDAFPKLMDSVEFKDPILPTTDIASTIVALAEKNKAEDLKRKQTQKAQRNKKKASSRRFKEPIIKEYVVPTDNDVLLGRGGRSKHHPGNKAYRDEVGNIRES
jgi:hypothetical protein